MDFRTRSAVSAIVMMLGAASAAMGQTGFTITGGMSNFDITNHCDTPCNELEVEIEDIRPEDVIHCYHNGNYGSPTITLSPSGTATIVDYRNPHHPTAINTIEHFGITLRSMTAVGAIRVRWMVGGVPATVNGQVPNNTGGGGTTPATQPILPSITADIGTGFDGNDDVYCTVTNNDTTQGIWVKRRANVSVGFVTLESLMTTDPVVTSTVQIDASPVFIGPGASITHHSDLIEIEDDQSVVFAAQYFQDIFTNGGPFGGQFHSIGAELGNVMTATLSGPEANCSVLLPTIIEQPLSQSGPAGSTVNLRVRADDHDLDVTYQWLREGVPLVDSPMFRGVDSDELSIEEVDAWSEGLYQVRVISPCGDALSDSALVFVTGHNNAPPRPAGCSADFDLSNAVDVTDLFGFLDAWFIGDGQDVDLTADFTDDGSVDVDDLFGYLDVWFTQNGVCH